MNCRRSRSSGLIFIYILYVDIYMINRNTTHLFKYVWNICNVCRCFTELHCGENGVRGGWKAAGLVGFVWKEHDRCNCSDGCEYRCLRVYCCSQDNVCIYSRPLDHTVIYVWGGWLHRGIVCFVQGRSQSQQIMLGSNDLKFCNESEIYGDVQRCVIDNWRVWWM